MIINEKRALAYIVKAGEIMPIEGADNIELVKINGWVCIAKIGEFKEGDLAVYFEIDSVLPNDEDWSAFLSSKNYKVKTMKLGKFHVISQGLALPYTDLFDGTSKSAPKLGDDVTELLGVKHIESKEEKGMYNCPQVSKKQQRNSRIQRMCRRHHKFFQKKIPHKMMGKAFWRNFFLIIFHKDTKPFNHKFPSNERFPYVHKSDEERCENIPYILKDKQEWIKTQKLDGTSATYLLARTAKEGVYEYFVCSRNVRQESRTQENYHSTSENPKNVYWEMSDKYDIKGFLTKTLEASDLNYVCLQGEIVGPSLQGNPHKFKEQLFFGYNLILSNKGRINSIDAQEICNFNAISWVPIVDIHYVLPDTMEELKLEADGPCIVGEGAREGWVYRSQDGAQSFKNVSRKYLIKHHD